MARLLGTLVLALVVAGCGGTSPRPTASELAALPSATMPPSTAAPKPTVVPMPMADPSPTADPTPARTPMPSAEARPTERPLSPTVFWYAADECFGDREVMLLGWLDTPVPFGYEGPEVRPNWLFYPPQGTPYFVLYDDVPTDPDHICECPGIFVHLAPKSDIVLDGPARWVVATGHRNDPAADRCHYIQPDEDMGELPDDAGARESCRTNFVLTELVNAPR